MIYVPSAPSREGWGRMMKATNTSTVRDALAAVIDRGMSEREACEVYRISRWPIRTAAKAFGLKFNDGRAK